MSWRKQIEGRLAKIAEEYRELFSSLSRRLNAHESSGVTEIAPVTKEQWQALLHRPTVLHTQVLSAGRPIGTWTCDWCLRRMTCWEDAFVVPCEHFDAQGHHRVDEHVCASCLRKENNAPLALQLLTTENTKLRKMVDDYQAGVLCREKQVRVLRRALNNAGERLLQIGDHYTYYPPMAEVEKASTKGKDIQELIRNANGKEVADLYIRNAEREEESKGNV